MISFRSGYMTLKVTSDNLRLLRYKCTFISSPEDSLLELIKLEFRRVSNFIWKKDGKVFGKSTVSLWHNFACICQFVCFHYIAQLWLIAPKNYSKFCTRKCKKQHYVCSNYNGISMIYINSNMALLMVRNH